MSGRSGSRTAKARASPPPRKKPLRLLFSLVLLPCLSAVLFAAAFPSFISAQGLGFFGFLALIPFFLALRILPLGLAPLASLIFSSLSFSLLAPWLFAYHPAAPLAVMFAMGVSGAAASLLMARALKRFPRFGFLLAAAAWVGMEYLRNSGFLAFPYGILGTSQYLNEALLQSASLWGVWGLSFLLAAASAFSAQLLFSLLGPRESPFKPRDLVGPSACMLALIAGSLILGSFFPETEASPAKAMSILAVQPDNEPRRSGALPAARYAERLDGLIGKGLAGHPEIDCVISSETAFPPSIELRMELAGDTEDDRAVAAFMRSLSSYGLPVILGNDRGRFGLAPDGERDRLHYNAALLIQEGKVADAYEKNELVPFIEYFPFYRAFPALYRYLEGSVGARWTPGSRIQAFQLAKARIGTPICYEDCFGGICRGFARSGAELLVPMASDAWSGSFIAMRQHLANAVFRAVETRLPLLRVSNDGISCSISPRGRIESPLPAFSAAAAIYRVSPRAPARTPYYLFGDWFPAACVLALALWAVLAFARNSFIDKTRFL